MQFFLTQTTMRSARCLTVNWPALDHGQLVRESIRAVATPTGVIALVSVLYETQVGPSTSQQLQALLVLTNAMARDQRLPHHVCHRGREYLREERFHEHYLRNRDAIRSLGTDLRGTISRTIASHYLDNIWFFKPADKEVREDVANHFVPHFYERREIVVQLGQLCVVERGAVGRQGRVLVPWSYWGDDMLLREKALRVNHSSITLTYTEIVTLSRENLSAVLVEYPEELRWFRRAAALVAFARAGKVYFEDLARGDVQLPWVHRLFEGAAAASQSAAAPRLGAQALGRELTDVEANAIGEVQLTMEERLQRILGLLERRDRAERAGLAPRCVDEALDRMQAQLDRLEAPAPGAACAGLRERLD